MVTDKNSTLAQENLVNIAFNAQSQKFDEITTSNPMEVLFRGIVRKHVAQFVREGQFMLELNCGTGLDALYFAELGLHVHATDNADGMLEQLAEKIKRTSAGEKISYQKCSFNNLELINSDRKFDHVFSNFGGLNCAENIEETIKQLDAHVNHMGSVHFVMIAPICLWEIAAVFKGRFIYAFRRFSKRGFKSKVEGHYFTTYYYSFSSVKKYFGNAYEVLQLRSLGCFLPPTYKEQFPAKRPALFKFLKILELKFNSYWPFNRIGDLYIVSLKKK